MPSLSLYQRDIGDVGNTFSSWDRCMTKAYCKWPAIVGIILGALIVISIIWCCARCLCCGAECCCGCLSCCNGCCPSGRKNNEGYQQQPPQPYGYQSPMPPMYGAPAGAWGATRGGYAAPQTASYEVSKKQGNAAYNEDALPAMPSWDNARDKREFVDDDVEMNRMDQNNPQTQPFLASGGLGSNNNTNQRYYNGQDAPGAGDMGTMHTSPYYDSDQNQRYVPSPVSTVGPQSTYPPSYHAYASPQSTMYEPNYSAGVPPSYHTPASPPLGTAAIGRKPVQGSFRNV